MNEIESGTEEPSDKLERHISDEALNEILDDDLNEEILEPEIFFGLVGAIGTDLNLVRDLLASALADVDYNSSEIKLSSILNLNTTRFKNDYDAYIKKMAAGTALRKSYKRGDAMILEGITEVWKCRKSAYHRNNPALIAVNDESDSHNWGLEPIDREAYVFNSIKHPKEVDTLRRIYGNSFYLIAAYSARENRVNFLSQKIADSEGTINREMYRADAEALLEKDRADHGDSLGQNVQKAFPLADVFINCDDKEQAKAAINRFIRLIFRDPFLTPTREEHAMFLAKAAAMRSSDLGRQVGAVVMSEDGEILTVGTNEVPKAGGGQYWDGDQPDQRDFKIGRDSNTVMKRNLLRDILKQLKEDGWLSEDKEEGIDDFVDSIFSGSSNPSKLKSSQLMSLIAYFRAVHAEMSCLTNAARRGISVLGHTLVCTTFPCHECARHIVASGLYKVIYIEPYPKSLTPDLYLDSVKVDQAQLSADCVDFIPFVGVAPRKYLNLFDAADIDRKEIDGLVKPWKADQARPRLSENPLLYIQKEAKRITYVWAHNEKENRIGGENI